MFRGYRGLSFRVQVRKSYVLYRVFLGFTVWVLPDLARENQNVRTSLNSEERTLPTVIRTRDPHGIEVKTSSPEPKPHTHSLNSKMLQTRYPETAQLFTILLQEPRSVHCPNEGGDRAVRRSHSLAGQSAPGTVLHRVQVAEFTV